MNDLVIMKNQQAVTSSLQDAETFDKEHRDVMKRIRDLTAQNIALGTGQVQIKDIHYVKTVKRDTWKLVRLLDDKYVHSSRRTFEDWTREARKNKWIK